MDRRTALFAELGLRAGDRVFIHYGNSLEFFVDLLSTWMLGACAVPIDPRWTPFEVETVARAAKPRFSVWDRDPAAEVMRAFDAGQTTVLAGAEGREPSGSLAGRVAAAVNLDQDALILFTSGSTGQPKGVVHTHRSLRARWTSLRDNLGLNAFRNTLTLLPTHFGHGLICNSLFPWLSGKHLFVLPPFQADILTELGSLIDKHAITFLSSVPPVWRIALKTSRPPARRSLERVFCGSAPLSAVLWDQVREWSGTRDVRNAYGITETGSWLAGLPGPDFAAEDGLTGEPWGGIVKVLRSGSAAEPPAYAEAAAAGESGPVWVKTPALMRGYLERDDLTSAVVSQGWFMTGDIGSIDERGLLYLKGRERDEINKGGMKVYPADIDNVVERFDGVVDVCTFPIADALLGENVGTAVVLESSDPTTLSRLREWVERHLAPHQRPARWYVVPQIARTSRGKLNRAAVRDQCERLTPAILHGPAGSA